MKRSKINWKNIVAGVAVSLFAASGLLLFVQVVDAATNISSTYPNYFSWNDVFGWADFYTPNTVNVTSPKMTGYASSSAGDISLDCATTRNGNICSPGNGNYSVLNDGAGNLSGWAWNDAYGWISFCGRTSGGASDCPTTTIAYQVQIDDSGVFGGTGHSGWAWNDIAGWISFNCNNVSTSGCTTYKVATTWTATSTSATLDSTTFDTGVANGAQLNSLLWHGSLPAGTQAKFQFAVSNASSGPWSYMGPDGGSGTFYAPNADTVTKLDYTLYNNYRYFRYRVTLVSNITQTLTPRVDDVIINWSP